MKQKIPPGVVVVALILVIIGVCWFGWHTVNGGRDHDVTFETIQYYQGLRAQMNAQHATNMGDAAKKGGPSYGTQASQSPGGAPGMQGAPSYGMAPGGPPTGAGSTGGSAPGR